MWRELIADIDGNAVFHAPCSDEEFMRLETTLNVSLPNEFAALLKETNGVEVAYGVSLVWSVNDIAENNMEMRSQIRPGGELAFCMPVDHLLIFGESGNGDLYAFPITPEGVQNRVFVWDHEDDSRTCQANSLAHWLRATSETAGS